MDGFSSVGELNAIASMEDIIVSGGPGAKLDLVTPMKEGYRFEPSL